MRAAQCGPRRFAWRKMVLLQGLWMCLSCGVIIRGRVAHVSAALAAAASVQQAHDAKARGDCIATSAEYTSFHCYDSGSINAGSNDDYDDEEEQPGSSCVDAHPSCQEWRDRGECKANPGYMLSQCPRSCEACENGHAGVTQVAPTGGDDDNKHHDHDLRRRVLRRIEQTRVYMRDRLRGGGAHDLHTCRNTNPLCAHRAALGECESSDVRAACPAACRRC
jgi:hypothetical protein